MFDWKSGDDEWVEEGTAVTAGPSSRFHLKARGLLALAALALLVVVGLGLAYRQATMQVTAVTNALEQEVMAADRLLVETAVAGDNDLFTAFLSRSPEWADAQIRLQTRGSLFDRPPMGLWLDTRADLFAGEFLSATQFIFAPDLNSAELRMTMPYVTLDEAGEMQPLLLQRTAVYRRQNNGWLLAEPDKTFWGDYVHEERPYLRLMTPTRDRDMAARLADDLNEWIGRICLDIACPREFQLQLRLAYDPETLLELHSPIRFSTVYAGGRQTTRLSLPTPTLVGKPVDETGYQVLLRGYATHLARALLNTYAFPAPAEIGGMFTNSGVDGMLAQWGLVAPYPTGFNPIIAAQPPPIPLPDQDILMLCPGSRALNLFRYDMAEDTWFDLPLATEGAIGFYLFPFPGGQGVALVIGPSVRDGLFRVVWLHNSREYLLFTTPDRPSITSVSELEPGQFLLSFRTDRQNQSGGAQGFIISAEKCDNAGCAIELFTELVELSPDGRYTLITRIDENQGLVYALGNAAGEEIQPLENAYDPIWLDGRTLAYLQSIPSSNPQQPPENGLMTAVFADDTDLVTMEPLLTVEDIRAFLPGNIRTLFINSIGRYPINQPEQLFIIAHNFQSGLMESNYLLQYELQTGKLSFLPEIGDRPIGTSGLFTSPDGRYLSLGLFGISIYEVHLYDIPNQRWQVYEGSSPGFISGHPLSWSDDGRWFILSESGLVRLVAPEYEYQKLLFHGLDNCVAALFVDRDRRDEAGP